jgi:hypothetical protein
LVLEDLEPKVWLSRREQREKEHSVCQVNRQEGMLIQFKPDAATQHTQSVLVSYDLLSAWLWKPVRQQRMLRHLGIEIWIYLQKIGW